jgi:hypothetical protein
MENAAAAKGYKLLRTCDPCRKRKVRCSGKGQDPESCLPPSAPAAVLTCPSRSARSLCALQRAQHYMSLWPRDSITPAERQVWCPFLLFRHRQSAVLLTPGPGLEFITVSPGTPPQPATDADPPQIDEPARADKIAPVLHDAQPSTGIGLPLPQLYVDQLLAQPHSARVKEDKPFALKVRTRFDIFTRPADVCRATGCSVSPP